MIYEKLMSHGSWSIKLKKTTPASIRRYLDLTRYAYSLIGVTSTRIDPSAYTAITLRNVCRYVGVYRSRPDEFSIEGAGLVILLGDEDGKGYLLTTAVNYPAGTPMSTLITGIMSNFPQGFTQGTLNNTGASTQSAYFYLTTIRAAFESACEAAGVEWRLNNDCTLDCATAANLFPHYTTPVVMSMRGVVGKDPNFLSLRSVEMSVATDVEDYTSAVYVIGRLDGGASVGSATTTAPFYNPRGGTAVVIGRTIDSTVVGRDAAPTVASQQLGRFSSLRKAVALTTDDNDVKGKVQCGDRIYVYDPTTPGLYDTANYQRYYGHDTYPVAVRVMGMEYPIRDGAGVYLLTSESSSQIIDISDWVEYETGTTRLEIGGSSRGITSNGIASGNLDISAITGDVPLAQTLVSPVSWSPSLTQSGSVAFTNNQSVWSRDGYWVDASFDLGITGTGSASNGIVIGNLPVAMGASNNTPLGQCWLYDASAGQIYYGFAIFVSSTSLKIIPAGAPLGFASNGIGSAVFTAALASGDALIGKLRYLAAAS